MLIPEGWRDTGNIKYLLGGVIYLYCLERATVIEQNVQHVAQCAYLAPNAAHFRECIVSSPHQFPAFLPLSLHLRPHCQRRRVNGKWPSIYYVRRITRVLMRMGQIERKLSVRGRLCL